MPEFVPVVGSMFHTCRVRVTNPDDLLLQKENK
jgi:hypothetical protein